MAKAHGRPTVNDSVHMTIWSYDHMILWPYDQMRIWSYDHMIIRSYDHMIIWPFDHMIIWPYDHMIMVLRPIFHDFWSYRPQDRSIWGKMWRGSLIWSPLGRCSSKTWPNWSKIDASIQKNPNIVFAAEQWNVGNRLKRVLTNFQTSPGLVQGVYGHSKFRKIHKNRQNFVQKKQ